MFLLSSIPFPITVHGSPVDRCQFEIDANILASLESMHHRYEGSSLTDAFARTVFADSLVHFCHAQEISNRPPLATNKHNVYVEEKENMLADSSFLGQ